MRGRGAGVVFQPYVGRTGLINLVVGPFKHLVRRIGLAKHCRMEHSCLMHLWIEASISTIPCIYKGAVRVHVCLQPFNMVRWKQCSMSVGHKGKDFSNS